MTRKRILQNSTCECCTALVFRPKVYLNMTNRCPKAQECTPSGSILKKFSSLQFTACTPNDLKENFCKTQLVNGVQPWLFGLKFILQGPISATKIGIVHHVKVFLKLL